ncbi:MAG: alpha/beta fold hydrolase [Anaerolineae bacterium]|nr:alpha/beta fold hydrolase [Anaerolineae bacterium]
MSAENTARPKWRTWQYWARLGTFGIVVAILTIFIGQLVFFHLDTDAMIKTAQAPVTLPDDFLAEEVIFAGGDGLTMAGWYIPPQNDTVIILLHGYDSHRGQLLWHARQLQNAGFGVLMYDMRGHGESIAPQRSGGWRDIEDVAGAIDFLADKAASIGIYGFSIGGQVALRSTAMLPQIQAVFVDGPSLGTADDLPQAAELRELIIFALGPTGDQMLSAKTGLPIPQGVVELLPQIPPRPIFFVATGERDNTMAEARYVYHYYEQVADYAQWWEIPETRHGGGWIVRPEEYTQNLVSFFGQIVPEKLQ